MCNQYANVCADSNRFVGGECAQLSKRAILRRPTMWVIIIAFYFITDRGCPRSVFDDYRKTEMNKQIGVCLSIYAQIFWIHTFPCECCFSSNDQWKYNLYCFFGVCFGKLQSIIIHDFWDSKAMLKKCITKIKPNISITRKTLQNETGT